MNSIIESLSTPVILSINRLNLRLNTDMIGGLTHLIWIQWKLIQAIMFTMMINVYTYGELIISIVISKDKRFWTNKMLEENPQLQVLYTRN